MKAVNKIFLKCDKIQMIWKDTHTHKSQLHSEGNYERIKFWGCFTLLRTGTFALNFNI